MYDIIPGAAEILCQTIFDELHSVQLKQICRYQI